MPSTKNISHYLFEDGAALQLPSILKERLGKEADRAFFLVDSFFEGHPLEFLSEVAKENVFFVDVSHEPTTDGIDGIVSDLRKRSPGVSAVVGVGGGSTLDTAKAVSNLLNNPGQAADYQGWDLVKYPGVYKIGVPTISGTGAEASRTCVLLNRKKNLKMGMNSDYTIFDELVLDPGLTATVPRDQYFFTGMDTFIHCIESLNGARRHALADAYSREALRLCAEVFSDEQMQSPQNRERLMAASYLGGAAIANSYVGVVHPFSAGLSVVLGTHHCVANCIVMRQMSEFYPKETEEFLGMVEAQGVWIPEGLCASLSDADLERLYESTIIHEKPLINALGEDFRKILTKEKVIDLFKKM